MQQRDRILVVAGTLLVLVLALLIGGGVMGPGMMGPGMMAQPRAQVLAPPMPISPEEAVRRANQFLEGYLPRAWAEDPKAFYGYYTLHVLRDGEITGMLSVHGQSGWVWPHTWHGAFIQELELTR